MTAHAPPPPPRRRLRIAGAEGRLEQAAEHPRARPPPAAPSPAKLAAVCGATLCIPDPGQGALPQEVSPRLARWERPPLHPPHHLQPHPQLAAAPAAMAADLMAPETDLADMEQRKVVVLGALPRRRAGPGCMQAVLGRWEGGALRRAAFCGVARCGARGVAAPLAAPPAPTATSNQQQPSPAHPPANPPYFICPAPPRRARVHAPPPLVLLLRRRALEHHRRHAGAALPAVWAGGGGADNA